MLQRDEMLAPEVIERLQQHHLLDLAEGLGAELGRLGRGLLVDRLEDAARAISWSAMPSSLGPLVDRQLDAEDAARWPP